MTTRHTVWCLECEADGNLQQVQRRLGAWVCPIHSDLCHITANPDLGRVNRNDLRADALSKGRSVDEIAPPVATPETDAAPPEGDDTKIVFLAGAIKAWWMHKCSWCERFYDKSTECVHTGTRWGDGKYRPIDTEPMWDTPLHQQYVRYRRDLQAILIASNRYLTYAPHNAYKGRWVEKAQLGNDANIALADLMVVMSPPNIPTDGTDKEVITAAYDDTSVLYVPSDKFTAETALWTIDMFFEIKKNV